jgi:hypothetical protein
LHLLKELSRIGGQAFDIPSLSFGIDGINCERRLSGTGRSGYNGYLVAGYRDIDVLEIVLPRALYYNEILHERRLFDIILA